MITAGIIKEVNKNSNGYNSNVCMVEIPIFKSASEFENASIVVEATICATPGVNDCYKIGDFVYIGFVDNKYNFPVILGKIYKGINSESCGYFTIQKLNVSGEVTLPESTSIGNIKYSDLLQNITYTNNRNNFKSDLLLISESNENGKLYSTESRNIGNWLNGEHLNRVTYVWENNIDQNTSFNLSINMKDNPIDFWWDTQYCYGDTIGQPFYKSEENNFSLSINKNSREAIVSGKVPVSIGKFYLTLLYTT